MNYAVERDNPEIPYEPNRWVMLTGTFTTNMQVTHALIKLAYTIIRGYIKHNYVGLPKLCQ